MCDGFCCVDSLQTVLTYVTVHWYEFFKANRDTHLRKIACAKIKLNHFY